MRLREPWFSAVAAGRKTIEGRLASYRCAYGVVDISNVENPARVFPVCVVRITHYRGWRELLEVEGLERVLPGVSTIEAGVQVAIQLCCEARTV